MWLDVSRLIWRVFRRRLTGIDRVELAYAEHLLAAIPERLRFVAFNYRGQFCRLPQRRAAALIREVTPAWRDGSLDAIAPRALGLFVHGLFVAPRIRRSPGAGPRPTYVNVSAHPIDWTKSVARLLRRTGAAFVPLVHDLIPLDYPEYVPHRWTLRHTRRLETIAGLADGVIANSAVTACATRPHLAPATPLFVAPLGVSVRDSPLGRHIAPRQRPYFVCLGTIEPRKNHITLLHVWRRLSAALGPNTPRLVIVGSRGWENEQVLDILERCEVTRPHVKEAGRLSDGEVARVLRGARALLMPSFTEGYGLPIAEALAQGTPVICSDIPAHREIGRGVPDYEDPIDGPAWERAVLDYAELGSVRRQAQIDRIKGWHCPNWSDHVARALCFIDRVALGSTGPADDPTTEHRHDVAAVRSEVGGPAWADELEA